MQLRPKICVLFLLMLCSCGCGVALGQAVQSELSLSSAESWIEQRLGIEAILGTQKLKLRARMRHPIDAGPSVFAVPGVSLDWLRYGSLELGSAWRDMLYPLPFSFPASASPQKLGILGYADFSVEKQGLHLRLASGAGADRSTMSEKGRVAGEIIILGSKNVDLVALSARFEPATNGASLEIQPWYRTQDREQAVGARLIAAYAGQGGWFSMGAAPGFEAEAGRVWNALWFELGSDFGQARALVWHQFLAALRGEDAGLQEQFGVAGYAQLRGEPLLAQFDVRLAGARETGFDGVPGPPDLVASARAGFDLSQLALDIQASMRGGEEGLNSDVELELAYRGAVLDGALVADLEWPRSLYSDAPDVHLRAELGVELGAEHGAAPVGFELGAGVDLGLPAAGPMTIGFAAEAALQVAGVQLRLTVESNENLPEEIYRGLNVPSALRFGEVFILGFSVLIEG